MARDLSRVKERDGLRLQREPYWQWLRAGCFIGFLPSKKSGAGTWIARAYDEDLRKYRMKALGDFGTVASNERFALAKKEAEAFADLAEAGGEVRRDIETAKGACEDYLTERPGKIAEGVFRRHVYDDPLAGVRLDKLRKHHLKAWRKRLEDAPAIVSRPKDVEGLAEAEARCGSYADGGFLPHDGWCWRQRLEQWPFELDHFTVSTVMIANNVNRH